jgi:hypothetical protein
LFTLGFSRVCPCLFFPFYLILLILMLNSRFELKMEGSVMRRPLIPPRASPTHRTNSLRICRVLQGRYLGELGVRYS